MRTYYWDRHDGEPYVPERGDLVFGPVALYEVLDARPVDSLQHDDRWRLELRRIGDNGPHLLELLAARPGARAHGKRILNTGRLHKEREQQVAGLAS